LTHKLGKSKTENRKLKKVSSKARITEKQTRVFIDKQLADVGWLKRYVKDEVNSVRTNFKEKEYVLSEGDDDKSGVLMS